MRWNKEICIYLKSKLISFVGELNFLDSEGFRAVSNTKQEFRNSGNQFRQFRFNRRGISPTRCLLFTTVKTWKCGKHVSQTIVCPVYNENLRKISF